MSKSKPYLLLYSNVTERKPYLLFISHKYYKTYLKLLSTL